MTPCERLVRLFWQLVERVVAWRDGRNKTSKWFPACQDTNFLYNPLYPTADGEAYYTKFHQADRGTNPFSPTFLRFKTDILKGRRYQKNHAVRLRIDKPSALPYAITGVSKAYPEGDYTVSLKVDGKEQALRGLVADRYYYLPLRQAADVELVADHDLIVGRPISLVQNKRHTARFVLALFIDSFSWEFAKHLNLEQDMPNVARFFAKGTIFQNCHSSSNWTLPGVATLVSGKTLTKHLIFHNARRDMTVGDGYPLLAEAFQENGYLTFQANSSIGISPAYGYAKGYDRTVYRCEMPLTDTLEVFFDHMRAFPERDHFAWLTIMDAHHTPGHVPDVASQLAVPLGAHDYMKKKNVKTPWVLEFDEGHTQRYIEVLKHIDRQLGRVFAFVEERYSDSEIVACIMSDHGIGFSTLDRHAFAAEQTHVAFMLRGPGVPAGLQATETMQNTDVMPAILKAAGLPPPRNIDGRLPECLGGPPGRNYALSENLYPGQTYLAAIKEDRFQFYLESEGLVNDDGDFQLGDFKVELFANEDWETDVAAQHADVVSTYTREVRQHIGK